MRIRGLCLKARLQKLLTWSWFGQSDEEAEEEVRAQEERIDSRKQARIKARIEADVTLTRPSSEDFEEWLGIGSSDASKVDEEIDDAEDS